MIPDVAMPIVLLFMPPVLAASAWLIMFLVALVAYSVLSALAGIEAD